MGGKVGWEVRKEGQKEWNRVCVRVSASPPLYMCVRARGRGRQTAGRKKARETAKDTGTASREPKPPFYPRSPVPPRASLPGRAVAPATLTVPEPAVPASALWLRGSRSPGSDGRQLLFLLPCWLLVCFRSMLLPLFCGVAYFQ